MVIVPSPERFSKVAEVLRRSNAQSSAFLAEKTQIKRSDLSPLITSWVRGGYLAASPMGNGIGNKYSITTNGEKVLGLIKKGVVNVNEEDLKRYGITINLTRKAPAASAKRKVLISPDTVEVLKKATTLGEVSDGLARISQEVFNKSQSSSTNPNSQEPRGSGTKEASAELAHTEPEASEPTASPLKTSLAYGAVRSISYGKLLEGLGSIQLPDPSKPKQKAATGTSTHEHMMAALLSAQTLAGSIASLVMDAVADEVEAQLDRMKEEIARVVKLKFEAEKESVRVSTVSEEDDRKKLKVLIVGLLPGQKSQIEQEFGKELDLRFAESSLMGKTLKKKILACDYCISMVNFISHTTENTILSTDIKYEKVAGGMSSLRDRLTALYVEGAKKEREQDAA